MIINSLHGSCSNALGATRSGLLTGNILSVIFDCINILIYIFILLYLLYSRRRAKQGYEIGTNRLLLPLYHQLIYAFITFAILRATVTGIWGMFKCVENFHTGIIMHALSEGIHHGILEAVPFALMQQGSGTNSNRTVRIWALFWGSFTAFWYFATYAAAKVGGSRSSYSMETLYTVSLFIFYACCWILPTRWLFRRPALKFYAMIYSILYPLTFLGDSLDASIGRSHPDIANCSITITTIIVMLIEPFLLVWTLVLDSYYWQGLWVSRNVKAINQPLLDNNWNETMAIEMAGQLDNLQQSDSIKILNFGYLELYQDSQHTLILGAGGSAKVFRGKYKGRPVAIKMITCIELTPVHIARFLNEAEILGRLKHDNIIGVVGVCIMPPAICLCLDLCGFGSLFDFLRYTESDKQKLATHGQHVSPLTWTRKLKICIECAKAVEFLHSQTPKPFLHNDIKSLNFFVGCVDNARQRTCSDHMSRDWHQQKLIYEPDSEISIKLGDFGESQFELDDMRIRFRIKGPKAWSALINEAFTTLRSSNKTIFRELNNESFYTQDCVQDDMPGLARPFSTITEDSKDLESDQYTTKDSDNSTRSSLKYRLYSNNIDQGLIKVARQQTPNWAAPEVFSRGLLTTKSDCYSLTVVLWEIITGMAPFDQYHDPEQIAEAVVNRKERPKIPANTPKAFKQLLKDGWNQNPNDRPNASEIVKRLNNILKKVIQHGEEDKDNNNRKISTVNFNTNSTDKSMKTRTPGWKPPPPPRRSPQSLSNKQYSQNETLNNIITSTTDSVNIMTSKLWDRPVKNTEKEDNTLASNSILSRPRIVSSPVKPLPPPPNANQSRKHSKISIRKTTTNNNTSTISQKLLETFNTQTQKRPLQNDKKGAIGGVKVFL